MTTAGNMYRHVRRGLAPAAKTILLRTGVLRAVRTLAPSRKLAILRYHAVCGPEGYNYASADICVTPAAFERHARYLAANHAVVALPDAVARLTSGQPLPANAVALTFDDGYADNLEAARTLHRHGLTGTFYLTAGCLVDGQPFWPAELRYLVSAMRQPCLELNRNGERIRLPLATERERTSAVRRVTRIFKSVRIHEREMLREELRRAAGAPKLPRVMLTWDEVREMHRMGMTIGSHTVTHPNLPSAGPEAASAEIQESKRRLEAEIDAPVTMFSYPNGGAERYFTPELQRIVRESGYLAATTSANGFVSGTSDMFGLERVQVAERLAELVFTLEVDRLALGRGPR
jgi:peptidoglycan/xylan/chitin deacetylase (PgdA/CDA1 family)